MGNSGVFDFDEEMELIPMQFPAAYTFDKLDGCIASIQSVTLELPPQGLTKASIPVVADAAQIDEVMMAVQQPTASDSSKMLELFTLSGARLAEQPALHDTGVMLRSRVAASLGVPCESVKILHGCSFVLDETLLADLSSGHLQLVLDRLVMTRKKVEDFWDDIELHQPPLRDFFARPPPAGTVETFFATVDIQAEDELNLLVSSIMQKAMTEPQLSETCAEAAAILHRRVLEFSTKPGTAWRTLAKVCKDKFQGLPSWGAEAEALVRFLCNLLSKHLLGADDVDKVVKGLSTHLCQLEKVETHTILVNLSRSHFNRVLIQSQIQDILDLVFGVHNEFSGDDDSDNDDSASR